MSRRAAVYPDDSIHVVECDPNAITVEVRVRGKTGSWIFVRLSRRTVALDLADGAHLRAFIYTHTTGDAEPSVADIAAAGASLSLQALERGKIKR